MVAEHVAELLLLRNFTCYSTYEVSGRVVVFSLYLPNYQLSPAAQRALGGVEDGLWLIEGVSYIPSCPRHLLWGKRKLNFMECHSVLSVSQGCGQPSDTDIIILVF